jgi:thiamine pyrophosphate-dependent acetolactate synthase large subunit-like protein
VAAIRPAKFHSRSLGVAAARAKTVHEATDLLRHALASGAPVLIDVVLDREFK